MQREGLAKAPPILADLQLGASTMRRISSSEGLLESTGSVTDAKVVFAVGKKTAISPHPPLSRRQGVLHSEYGGAVRKMTVPPTPSALRWSGGSRPPSSSCPPPSWRRRGTRARPSYPAAVRAPHNMDYPPKRSP